MYTASHNQAVLFPWTMSMENHIFSQRALQESRITIRCCTFQTSLTFYLFWLSQSLPVTSFVKTFFFSFVPKWRECLKHSPKHWPGMVEAGKKSCWVNNHMLFILLLSSRAEACLSRIEGVSQRGNAVDEQRHAIAWWYHLWFHGNSYFSSSTVPKTKIRVSSAMKGTEIPEPARRTETHFTSYQSPKFTSIILNLYHWVQSV